MEKAETLADFYQKKFDWIPDNIRGEIGHFNVFRLDPFTKNKPQPIPYKRRDFYKIMLVKGHSKVHYADKVMEVQKQALSFSNPHIPYKWEHLDNIREGFFCIFNQHFFHQFGNLSQYQVFQPNGIHIFELNDQQVIAITHIYERIFEEINSDYIHKYDVLRNLVFELLHFAMKMQPSAQFDKQHINASQRIATLFLELLERQFPIDESHPTIGIRAASDFANQLNIHVNHLNKAVKEITQKTTSQLIAERILQESKVLLKHSNWNIAEIADALGFTEVTHFNNFFKKHTTVSPSKFRSI
ncbi:helix-turn-helix domain-containing protein [Flectobacillus major]|uniref:helix-turn-helix domain-containing protein n=1 Tax=Flectobacillus major TaxID=103 RepID=UPI00040B74DC|nr:AraC family transcriptional regulator [Flectobacillus major]